MLRCNPTNPALSRLFIDANRLSIWRDLDADGITDDGELRPLSEFDIASIDLAAVAIGETNEGHPVKYRSHVTLADGSTAATEPTRRTATARSSSSRSPRW